MALDSRDRFASITRRRGAPTARGMPRRTAPRIAYFSEFQGKTSPVLLQSVAPRQLGWPIVALSRPIALVKVRFELSRGMRDKRRGGGSRNCRGFAFAGGHPCLALFTRYGELRLCTGQGEDSGRRPYQHQTGKHSTSSPHKDTIDMTFAKILFSFASLGALCIAVGCSSSSTSSSGGGGGGGSGLYCSVPSSMVCYGYKNLPSEDTQSETSACTAESGTIVSSCPSDGLVGCCSYTEATIDTEECYYMAGSASEDMSSCSALSGTFTTTM
jgi:hypothetical protein